MSESRGLIVETADDVFYRRGFVGVSVEDLLAASGLSRGTFYKHFRSKHAVVLAVLARRAALFEDAIARGLADAHGRDAIADGLFAALADWHATHGARGCLFQTAASEYGRGHPDVLRLARDHKTRVRGLVEAALARAGVRDARSAAEPLVLLMEGAVALGQFADQRRQIEAARRVARSVA
ncbi:TetR/AcrR family transcriptional regulator [Salinarimonas rosea]|uniref:TetR/AcrR family transcriptional regulator n=1 Tax=Salinarimonas rosea TaxID=552063 RepID=UPI0003F5D578|nr:TetR/AcrR family transcriptional regulator [Salinarimonas rosea]